MTQATAQFLHRIPDEEEVRKRLADNQREANLLRSLLRVAKQKTAVEGPKPQPTQMTSR